MQEVRHTGDGVDRSALEERDVIVEEGGIRISAATAAFAGLVSAMAATSLLETKPS